MTNGETSPAILSAAKYQPELKSARSGKALCVSGGGFRAALFHLGALRRLNETGLLSKLTTISSVSGGSVVSGLLAKVWSELAKDRDPVSGVFRTFEALCEKPLRKF